MDDVSDAGPLDTGAKKGTCSNVPDATNPQCCQPSTTFAEGFEVGAPSSWTTLDCNSKTTKWIVSKTNPYKGTRSLCFQNQSGTGYGGPPGTVLGPRCTICSPAVKIAAGAVYNQLRFAVRMQTQFTGATTYVNPHPLTPELVRDFLAVFVVHAGKEKKSICFRFDAGNTVANSPGGICIDDVEVALTCT